MVCSLYNTFKVNQIGGCSVMVCSTRLLQSHTTKTKPNQIGQDQATKPNPIHILNRPGENFWRVLNCVAQRVCWGREKVGQKAAREGGES